MSAKPEWLSVEEWELYRECLKWKDMYGRESTRIALESLAEQRELMSESKQYIEDDLSGMPFDEEQAKQLNGRGQEIYGELAKCIEGYPRKIDTEEEK